MRALLLSLAILLTVAVPARAEAVVVFAAASLKTALDEMIDTYRAATGQEIVASFAGSSVLARQITRGAPADIFVSANQLWMDELEAADAIRPESRTDLIRNQLVLVAHDPGAGAVDLEQTGTLAQALGTNRLAMALVEAVPAGIYAKAALETLGHWQGIADNVVQTDNVRAALALVIRGEAAFGLVYASDAAAAPEISVVAKVPAGSHPPILYPAALTTKADSDAARDFFAYLTGPQAADTLTRHGFLPLTE